MQTKYLCILIHIWIGGRVGAVKPGLALQWDILLNVPGHCFFCGYFMFFSVLCLLCLCVCLFVCALWSPAGKGLPRGSRLWCLTLSLSLFHWYPWSDVVLDCIDS